MAKYLVNDTSLTAVADAIRTKGGTTGELEFPSGFVSAVEGIQAGGGGSDVFASVLEGTITEINDNTLTNLRNHAFYQCKQLKKATFAKVTRAGQSSFHECSELTEINLPAFNGPLANGTFQQCSKLETVNILKVTTMSSNAFNSCSALKEINFPDCTMLYAGIISGSGVEKVFFRGLTKVNGSVLGSAKKLVVADLGNLTNIPGTLTDNSPVLEAVILRSATVCTLSSATNNFNKTPLVGVNGVYSGHVYVPASLISDYQQATNWATLYANYPDIFRAIEGSEYE